MPLIAPAAQARELRAKPGDDTQCTRPRSPPQPALIALIGTAAAQDWPTRPITMVIPFAPGGGIDAIGRIQAQRMGELLGQTIVVDNLGAAAGTVGSQRVAKANPDGYLFLMGNSGTHAYSQGLRKQPAYNSITDFTPIGLGHRIAAHPARAQGPAGEQPAGVRDLCEEEPGQDAVRLRRRRRRHAPAVRAPQHAARRQGHARALQGRGPCHAGPDRRAASTISATPSRPARCRPRPAP